LSGWQTRRPEPFPIYEYDDRAHLLYVVQHRAAVKPHIVTPAEATAALRAAKAAKAAEHQPQGYDTGGNPLINYYGSERGVITRGPRG
jgi:hypothetical protein